MEPNNVIWQDNEYSSEYVKSLRKTKIIPFLLLLLGLILTLFFSSFWGRLIFLSITIFVSFMAFLSLRSGDKNLTSKVGFSDKGIHYIKRNNKKGFIPWERVHTLAPIDNKFEDYLLLYEGREKIEAYNWFGYTALALGYNVVPEAIERFNRYKVTFINIPSQEYDTKVSNN